MLALHCPLRGLYSDTMNYRHIYHAGNFADVVKHVTLIALLEALQRKDKPFCYLDTHAGIGSYRLDSEAAGKTQEFRGGIARVLKASSLSGLLARYVDLVALFNDSEAMTIYPGSPALALSLLREQDRAVLNELHAVDAAALKALFRADPRVAVHRSDGYHALKAFVPPRERRGLVLIDPPFEQPGEFQRMVEGLCDAYARWPGGVYALWYPLKDRREVQRFHRGLEKSGIRRQLLIEFRLRNERPDGGLAGTGMIVVNPPWQLEEALRPALQQLQSLLGEDAPAQLRLEWLVPE